MPMLVQIINLVPVEVKGLRSTQELLSMSPENLQFILLNKVIFSVTYDGISGGAQKLLRWSSCCVANPLMGAVSPEPSG
jgi:hypothetical protein